MIALSLGWLSACDSEKPEPPVLSIPSRQIIKDAKGRSLAVEIIGKDSESITFIRESDQKRYTYPLSQLSKSDQEAFTSFPNQEPPEEIVEKPAFITNREKEIEKLESELRSVREKAYSPKIGPKAESRFDEQIQEIENEITKLRAAITDYEWRMKLK